MDLEESSSSDGFVTIHLPDDMLLFLAKHYLKEQDWQVPGNVWCQWHFRLSLHNEQVFCSDKSCFEVCFE